MGWRQTNLAMAAYPASIWRHWGFPRHEHFFPIVIVNPIHKILNLLNSTDRYTLYYLNLLISTDIQQIQLDELQTTFKSHCFLSRPATDTGSGECGAPPVGIHGSITPDRLSLRCPCCAQWQDGVTERYLNCLSFKDAGILYSAECIN